MSITNVSFWKIRQEFLSDSDEPRQRIFIRYAALAVLIALGLWLAYFLYVAMVWPYQIEYREGAPLVMTRLLLEGRNPFTFENQPLATNNYGILYNLIVVPVAAVLGNTLPAHRLVSVVSIVLCFLLVYREIYRTQRDAVLAAACGEIVVVGLSAIGGLGAFPGALGALIYLAALLIPLRRDFDRRSLIYSALLCVLAFYTKPYYLLACGIVASYLFVFLSPKKAIWYTALFGGALLISVVLVRTLWPFYFVDTFFSNINQAQGAGPGHLYKELKILWAEFYPGLIAAAAVILLFPAGLLLRTPAAKAPAQSRFSFLDRPVLPWRPDYFLYAFICALLAFSLVLGMHTFNIMNAMPYSYQLVLPPFFLWLAAGLKPRSWLGLALTLLLVFNAVWFTRVWMSPDMLNDLLETRSGWEKLDGSLRLPSRILNTPLIAANLIESGKWPVDSGHTEFYYEIADYPHMELVGPGYQTITEHGDLYLQSIRKGVREREFDTVVVTQYDALNGILHLNTSPNSLTQHYRLTQKLRLFLPLTAGDFNVTIWTPIQD